MAELQWYRGPYSSPSSNSSECPVDLNQSRVSSLAALMDLQPGHNLTTAMVLLGKELEPYLSLMGRFFFLDKVWKNTVSQKQVKGGGIEKGNGKKCENFKRKRSKRDLWTKVN
jgi:hypothetical protein